MQLSEVAIMEAVSAEQLDDVRRLFRNYAAWLDVDLCFQSFEAELAVLPGRYAPPAGQLLLAKVGDSCAACVGLRPLQPNVCEMKRLWVEPQFQGHGLGRRLANEIVAAGARLGYEAMRLDTIPDRLQPAQHIYQSLGFQEIPPYYENPLDGVVMFELNYNKKLA